MDVKAEGMGHRPIRTLAEIMENLRFNQLLVTLDTPTATLLQCERLRWSIAETARRHELAELERQDRVLRDLAAMW